MLLPPMASHSVKVLKKAATPSGQGPCCSSNCAVSAAASRPITGMGAAQQATRLMGGEEGTMSCTQNRNGAGLCLQRV